MNRITEIIEGTNITYYYYDLNSKPLWRVYPSGVWEARTFDAMGRLLTMSTHGTDSQMMFDMTYEYDLVGSALKMTQTSNPNITGTQDAVTTWGYDDRYRLTNETVAVAGGTTSSSSYTWDDADNRLSMTKYSGGSLSSVTVYTNNALNQMTGYVAEAPGLATTNVVFSYDANGSRTNKTETIGGTTSSLSYTYDEDNRLVNVALNGTAITHTFEYDYRSRRYYRSTPAVNHMFSVFDGGLAVQEYEPVFKQFAQPATYLKTEFVRSEGMGGGVGGMVYSIKDDGNGGDNIISSHANHRGDVIARSDENGDLTSFALYEAYGTRPYEWGDDPDRQKANTKEEETDLGLLNEGMRFRDLETGVFLTRDPIG